MAREDNDDAIALPDTPTPPGARAVAEALHRVPKPAPAGPSDAPAADDDTAADRPDADKPPKGPLLQ
jgi:hypothetical protein